MANTFVKFGGIIQYQKSVASIIAKFRDNIVRIPYIPDIFRSDCNHCYLRLHTVSKHMHPGHESYLRVIYRVILTL